MINYAHTRPNSDPATWDPLLDHLQRTARHAEKLAASFAPRAAHLAGLWHDVGKFRPEFQQYLRNSTDEGYRDASTRKYEHAIVGAYQACQNGRSDVGLAVAAHHGYLHAKMEFRLREVERAKTIFCPIPPNLLEFPVIEKPPADAEALWIRFLFSALVDADSLETELWDKGHPRKRCERTIPELLEQLELYIANELDNRTTSPMNSLRRDVQQYCRESASNPPGSFRLTVPTGGGKTLSSLLFALRHASIHSLRRVIVVIPYTSIIEQTASTFRNIFGDGTVLEHHCNLDYEKESALNRQCTENWDSPIIVTTSVQFFESLHANRKRDLRKLHSIAKSVVVLDEVQTFPLELVKPIKDVLSRLNLHFGVTTVHCSATQPLLVQPEAIDIVPKPETLFAITKNRVQVTWDVALPTEWTTLAAAIRDHPKKQVLTIVHRKQDAIDLARAVGGDCIHLSTLMCPAHRKAKLEEIRRRLENKQPCLVVSTQLVEAGVDIDFPVVYRALAGIDSLAQAAGRCNREGRQAEPGEYHIFLAPSDPPAGTLRAGFQIVKTRIAKRSVDLFDPGEYASYFKNLKDRITSVTKSTIPSFEKDCDFPKVEELFKMIEDEGTPLIAPYGSDWERRVRACRADPSIRTFRNLQPYTVSVRKKFLGSLQATGCLAPLFDESESGWVVFKDQGTLYSGSLGFGAGGSEELPFLDA